MKHAVMYVIIGLIIMGAILHPAGSTALLETGSKGVLGVGGLLEGQGATGGVRGNVSGVGSFA